MVPVCMPACPALPRTFLISTAGRWKCLPSTCCARSTEPGAGIWWRWIRETTKELGALRSSPYSLGQGSLPRAEGYGFQLIEYVAEYCGTCRYPHFLHLLQYSEKG